MKACMGCGTPIPQLELGNGFNFVCSKCRCETRPQDSFDKAEKLWNEGRIYPKNESEFMRYIINKAKER